MESNVMESDAIERTHSLFSGSQKGSFLDVWLEKENFPTISPVDNPSSRLFPSLSERDGLTRDRMGPQIHILFGSLEDQSPLDLLFGLINGQMTLSRLDNLDPQLAEILSMYIQTRRKIESMENSRRNKSIEKIQSEEVERRCLDLVKTNCTCPFLFI